MNVHHSTHTLRRNCSVRFLIVISDKARPGYWGLHYKSQQYCSMPGKWGHHEMVPRHKEEPKECHKGVCSADKKVVPPRSRFGSSFFFLSVDYGEEDWFPLRVQV